MVRFVRDEFSLPTGKAPMRKKMNLSEFIQALVLLRSTNDIPAIILHQTIEISKPGTKDALSRFEFAPVRVQSKLDQIFTNSIGLTIARHNKPIKMSEYDADCSSYADSEDETSLTPSSPCTDASVVSDTAYTCPKPFYKPVGNTQPFAKILCDLLSAIHHRVEQPGPQNVLFYFMSDQPRLIESETYNGYPTSLWTFKRVIKRVSPPDIQFAARKWKDVKFEYYIWADLTHDGPEGREGPSTVTKTLRGAVRAKRNGGDPGWKEIVAALKNIMARYERNGL